MTAEEKFTWSVLAAARRFSGVPENMPSEREIELARTMQQLADPKGVRFRDLKAEALMAYEAWVESVRKISGEGI